MTRSPVSRSTRDSKKDSRSGARGALLGLAVGDALGTTLEFTTRDTRQPLTDIVGGGPFRLPAGVWTDDTSMALCLGDSLLACLRHDPVDQLCRYMRWYQQGENSPTGECFDIGITVRTALHRFAGTLEPYPGLTDERSAGNGSLMRLAPIALYYGSRVTRVNVERELPLLIEMAGLSSMTTHAHPQAVAACKVMALWLDRAIQCSEPTRGNKRAILTLNKPLRSLLGDLPAPIAAIIAGSYRHKTRDEISSSGYVVHSLEAALWAFWSTDNFADGALLAANLGGDADSVAAIYGQLAGAFYGVESIPETWLNKLAWREQLDEMAQKLVERGTKRLPQNKELRQFVSGIQANAHLPAMEQAELACHLCWSNDLDMANVMDWKDLEEAERPYADLVGRASQWSLLDCCSMISGTIRRDSYWNMGEMDFVAQLFETGVFQLIVARIAELVDPSLEAPPVDASDVLIEEIIIE